MLALVLAHAVTVGAPAPAEGDAAWTVPETFQWVPPIVHATGLFVVMRSTEAYLWPSPFAESPKEWPRHWAEAFGKPPLFDTSRRAFEWDGDRWFINVLGHGLLGSELHLRARTCGAGVGEALLFGAAASVAWEYVFEGNGVRPSGLDLVYTPLAGLVLGEARFWAFRAVASAGKTTRAVVRAIVDPLGELERTFSRC